MRTQRGSRRRAGRSADRYPAAAAMMELLEPRLLLSTTYPDLQVILKPADDPTLPGAMALPIAKRRLPSTATMWVV